MDGGNGAWGVVQGRGRSRSRGNGRGRARGRGQEANAPARGRGQEANVPARRPGAVAGNQPPAGMQQTRPRPDATSPPPLRDQPPGQNGHDGNGSQDPTSMPVRAAPPGGNAWGRQRNGNVESSELSLPPPLRDPDVGVSDRNPGAGPPAPAPASDLGCRTRSRGGGEPGARPPGAQPPGARPPGARPPANAEGISAGLGRMQVGGDERRRRRADPESEDELIVTRPQHVTNKMGTTGMRVNLLVNCFSVNQAQDMFRLYQYDVTFKPPIENKHMRIGIVKSQPDIIGTTNAFDGKMLFLPSRLAEEPTIFTVARRSDNAPIEVTIRLICEVPADDPTALQMMNIILKRVFSEQHLERVGRHYFNPNMNIDIPRHRISVWPGYDSRIRQFEHGTLLCTDLKFRVLRMDTVLDLMEDINHRTRRDNRAGAFKEACVREIVGQTVLTRYNNRTYRIDDIDWNQSPESTFETSKGAVSYIDYYRRAHNVDITNPGQCLLVTKTKARERRAGMSEFISLIPELCYLTGITDGMRRNRGLMEDMATHTRINPESRQRKLEEFSHHLATDEAALQLKNWDIEVNPDLVRLPGRLLPPERIHQKTTQFTYEATFADWTKGMRGNALISTPPMNELLVLFTRADDQLVNDFIGKLQRVSRSTGIMFPQHPTFIAMENDRPDTYVRSLTQNIQNTTKMVICIVSSDHADRYNAIKKMCCCNHPVLSQVVIRRTIQKDRGLSVATKIAIQLNCKLGGEAWALEIPLKKTMIIGIDVYHKRGNKSVGAFVASMNAAFTRYHSQQVFLDQGQELQDNLRVMLTASLKRYLEINRELPGNVIVYRDGVGDGQLAMVFNHELTQLQGAFAGFPHPDGSPYRPKLGLVVVKKRIPIRFMLHGQNGSTNPLCGTVVDDVVTSRNWYDFYVVSQSVRQGTVSPTHYNVIFSDLTVIPDHMQRLTYKLCHLYVNWPGTVSVPAPCMYAHKLAYLVGENLKMNPSPALADFLWYL